jgi:hypothetical protein
MARRRSYMLAVVAVAVAVVGDGNGGGRVIVVAGSGGSGVTGDATPPGLMSAMSEDQALPGANLLDSCPVGVSISHLSVIHIHSAIGFQLGLYLYAVHICLSISCIYSTSADTEAVPVFRHALCLICLRMRKGVGRFVVCVGGGGGYR